MVNVMSTWSSGMFVIAPHGESALIRMVTV